MISITDFKQASFEKKCELITTQTTYIDSRCECDTKIYLYHSGNYFIEVNYSPTHKRVMVIRAFNEPEGLLPYVEMVSLNDLKS